jgi:iron complex transport system substrate-binding protein
MDGPSMKLPTRRKILKSGGALVGGGLLAGCTGGSGSSNGDNNSNNSGGGANGSDGSNGDGNATSGGGGNSYSVTMAPVGTVSFEAIPERWIAYGGDYADMGIALGQGDSITGLGGADRYYTYFYDQLSGVSVDRSQIKAHPEVRTKEEFYELNNDVHLYDPQMLINWFDWDQSDVDTIASNVAPFLGNLIFRRSDDWHEDYPYYTLYGAFAKIAELFQEQERYKAFKQFHDGFISEIQTKLPSTNERPRVFLTYAATTEPESFTPYRLNDKGTSKKQWRDLKIQDALVGTGIANQSSADPGELDYEALLEIDPEAILIRGHALKSAIEFRNTVLKFMRNHPVGSELTAVKNGRVYRGGYLRQGPIHNLFLTERGAKQMYPDIFGKVTSDKQLFDRQPVADIVNGNF